MRSRAWWVVVLLLASGCGGVDPVAEPAPGEVSEAGDGWTRLPDPPLPPRTGAVTVAVGSSVVVVGGWEFLCPPNADCMTPPEPLRRDGAVYDVATRQWRPMAASPFGIRRGEQDVVAIGSSVYVLTKCRRGPQCTSAAELLRYDVDGDRWVELGVAPGPGNAYRMLAVAGEDLVSFSGSDEDAEVPDFLWRAEAERWVELPDDPLSPAFGRFVVADDETVAVFGSPLVEPDEESTTKVGAVFDRTSDTWAELPAAPTPGYQVWGSGGRFYLNGHYVSGGAVLSPGAKAWKALPEPGRSVRSDLTGLVGADSATYDRDNGWVLDTASLSYVEIPPRPGREEAYDESVTAVGRDLVVFGGQDWSGSGDGEQLSETWLWSPGGAPPTTRPGRARVAPTRGRVRARCR